MQMLGQTPRSIGNVVFFGNRRDLVHKNAREWVSESTCAYPGKAARVPNSNDLWMVSGLGSVEVDLNGANACDARAFFTWVTTAAQSRHVLFEKHVVVVYAAELADTMSLTKLALMPYTVLVAATTHRDCAAIRRLESHATFVRVPCPDAWLIPHHAKCAIDKASRNTDVCEIRKCVHNLKRMGFSSCEVAKFFVAHTGMTSTNSAVIAHLASLMSTSSMHERALETLALLVLEYAKYAKFYHGSVKPRSDANTASSLVKLLSFTCLDRDTEEYGRVVSLP